MTNYSENVSTLLAHLEANFKDDAAKVRALSADGIPFWKQLHAWGSLAAEVVAEIALAGREIAGITSNDKLMAAVEFLTELVNIPFVPKYLERKFVQFGIHTIWGVVKKFVEDTQITAQMTAVAPEVK